jgi:glutamine amidotransferase
MTGIAIVDYGMANLRSVQKAFERVGAAAEITSDPHVVARAEKVVLPGVGAFRDAIVHLKGSGLAEPIGEHIARGRPFLGICLGLQMLFERSEEGPSAGLGILRGPVVRFGDLALPGGERLKVPHMGWSPVHQVRAHPLWAGIEDGARFYFAHSYYPAPDDTSLTAGTAEYPAPFTCAVARANIFAVQFHPEKSHDAGLALLANFVRWDGRG